MSEATLKIVRAPRRCTCPKCAPKVAAAKYTMADYAKAIAALVSQGKWELPWVDAPPDLNERLRPAETDDQIAARLQKVARQQLTEMGVPLPPDLNAAIREQRAKEKK